MAIYYGIVALGYALMAVFVAFKKEDKKGLNDIKAGLLLIMALIMVGLGKMEVIKEAVVIVVTK